MKRVSTGVRELDRILQGGFPQGSTVLIVGRPGTGKTILANQIMFHNSVPDNKGVYLTSLAEPQVKVLHFQQEFDYFDKGKFNKSVIYKDLGSILRREGPEGALVFVDRLLKEHDPGLVVIDTIKTIADMISSYTEFRKFVLDLSLRTAVWGCTVLLLGEYSEEDIETRPESAIADGIIYLSGTEEEKFQKRYLRIMKMRGTDIIAGKNVFKITKQGFELYPRLKPDVENQIYYHDSDRISVGIQGLDRMMAGGLLRSTTTLVCGETGTGKTLLGLHYTDAALKKGENVVYISYEENQGQLVANAKPLGIDLKPYINDGRLQLIYIPPTELDLDELFYRVQKLVDNSQVKRLVMDSISSFEIGMVDKQKYTDYIWAFCDYFKYKGVNLFLTLESDSSDRISGITKHGISFVADNIILLRYIEEGMDLKRYLRIVKLRGCEHDTMLREIRVTENGIVI